MHTSFLSRVFAGFLALTSAGLFGWYIGILIERFLARRVGVEKPAANPGRTKIDLLVVLLFAALFAMPAWGHARANAAADYADHTGQADGASQVSCVPRPLPPVPAASIPFWQRKSFKFTAAALLMASGQFDAHETRQLLGNLPPDFTRVIGGRPFPTIFSAREVNPLLRPFASSAAAYPAIGLWDAGLSAWLLRAHGKWNRRAALAVVGVQIGLHVGLGINNWYQHDAQWTEYRELSPGSHGLPRRPQR